MMPDTVTTNLELENLPPVEDESTQLNEGIVGNLILTHVVVVKLSLPLYV